MGVDAIDCGVEWAHKMLPCVCTVYMVSVSIPPATRNEARVFYVHEASRAELCRTQIDCEQVQKREEVVGSKDNSSALATTARMRRGN
jgi:hypothetical protein